jgi:4'-phosphopantetheinyl transferase
VLSLDERRRARRFRFARDRVAWVGARTALRRILANYLECAPRELAFAGGERDKPTLVADGTSRLRFNVSHSGALGLVAASVDGDVGVDVERIADDDRDLVAIARRVFCDAAVEALLAAPVSERPAIFFRTWVRNEARVKYEGSGLTDAPDEGAGPSGDAGDPSVVLDLDVGDGYVAALAARADTQVIRQWALP